MKVLIITWITVFIAIMEAQAPDTLWTRTYGGDSTDIGCSVQQTLDGGYIIAGYTNSFGSGGYDLWVLKTDSLGDTLWTRTYGGVYDDYGYDIEQTTDNGYICAGSYRSTSDPFSSRVYIVKLDMNGDTVWTKTYIDSSQATAIKQTHDGGYIVSYNRQHLEWPYFSGYIMKIDNDGYVVWISPCGETCNDVQQTSDHGFVGVGIWHYSSMQWFPRVMKRDSLGGVQWEHTYVSYLLGWGTSVVLTQDEGYVILGYSGYNSFLFKIDSLGTTVFWDHLYSSSIHGFQLVKTPMSGLIIVGGYYYRDVNSVDLYVWRTDSAGETLWSAMYGDVGGDVGRSIDNTDDGGYIIAGQVSGSDLWLLKLSEDPYAINEQNVIRIPDIYPTTTIICGSLKLPEGKEYKVYDIMGRVVEPATITRGIYFIEIDGVVTQKVVKIR